MFIQIIKAKEQCVFLPNKNSVIKRDTKTSLV